MAFLGAHVALPIGVALLIAAVIGVLLVALPGTAWIVQLDARQLSRDAGGRAARAGPTSPSTTGLTQAPPPSHQEG